MTFEKYNKDRQNQNTCSLYHNGSFSTRFSGQTRLSTLIIPRIENYSAGVSPPFSKRTQSPLNSGDEIS
jgi:hypothetical protein